jgi:hypothetical protein
VRDERGNLRACQAFLAQARRDLGQLGPGAPELVGSRGLLDLVSERHGAFRTQPQEIAGRQRPDQASGVVGDAQMPHAHPVHARHGEECECVVGHTAQRTLRGLSHADLQRLSTLAREQAQHIALGNDAGVIGRQRLFACLEPHEHR